MFKSLLLWIFICLLSWTTLSAGDPGSPRVFFIDPLRIPHIRLLLEQKDPSLEKGLQDIRSLADEILEKGQLYSVTFNDKIPPSGDIHDFYSQSPYWWRNPDTESGLPYIRKDGKINPERDLVSDRKPCEKMISDVRTLAIAFAFTGDARYGEWAAQLLNTWFLDEETRMNPNLKHGQAIPGVHEGAGGGIIGTRKMVQLVSLVPLLEDSSYWTSGHSTALKGWFSQYLDWLMDSPLAAEERARENNHGSSYDMQLIAYALYTGRNEVAMSVLPRIQARIDYQIEADGTQPKELARTKGWHYSNENLKYLMSSAILAKRYLGVDLFVFKGEDGAGIPTAIDYLVPYAMPSKNPWPYQQITGLKPDRIRYMLKVMQDLSPQPEYEEVMTARGWSNQDGQLMDLICLPVWE